MIPHPGVWFHTDAWWMRNQVLCMRFTSNARQGVVVIELIQAGGWLMLPILLFWPTAAAFRLTGHGNRGEGMREQRKP